jgi:hypothetical protein
VAAASGALPEVVGAGGVTVRAGRNGYADGILAASTLPADEPRRRAEQFSWPASVAGMLAVHRLDRVHAAG